jgi:hypothetical protein
VWRRSFLNTFLNELHGLPLLISLVGLGKRLFRLLKQLPAGISKEDRYALLNDDASDAAERLFALGLAEWSEHESLDLLPPIRDVARHQYPPLKSQKFQNLLNALPPRGLNAGRPSLAGRRPLRSL